MAYDNLRIIRLQAENVKKLVAVEISPSGDLVTIAGKNGQGKTSVLDSILWAMAGGRAIQWKPIREGEESATIRLELGNDDGLQLIVTRTFYAKEDDKFTTNLTVRTADGMKPQGEQNFLDALVGALSFDPAAFIRSKPDEQIKILKGLIAARDPEADFAAIDAERKKAFDARTEVKRAETNLRASVKPDVLPEGDSLEAEPLADVKAVLDKLADFGRRSEERSREVAARESQDRILRGYETRIEETEDRIADLQEQLAAMQQERASVAKNVAARDPLPEMDSVDGLMKEHADLERANSDAAHRNLVRSTLRTADARKAEAHELTTAIEACDQRVHDLIERADLPVRGLELGSDFVMLRGVPFNQASDAEQLRASMALGMAANPKLRVLRIRDGSLLDDDALAVIREVAGDMNFQIWLEKVGDGGPEAFILENGMLRS